MSTRDKNATNKNPKNRYLEDFSKTGKQKVLKIFEAQLQTCTNTHTKNNQNRSGGSGRCPADKTSKYPKMSFFLVIFGYFLTHPLNGTARGNFLDPDLGSPIQ